MMNLLPNWFYLEIIVESIRNEDTDCFIKFGLLEILSKRVESNKIDSRE